MDVVVFTIVTKSVCVKFLTCYVEIICIIFISESYTKFIKRHSIDYIVYRRSASSGAWNVSNWTDHKDRTPYNHTTKCRRVEISSSSITTNSPTRDYMEILLSFHKSDPLSEYRTSELKATLTEEQVVEHSTFYLEISWVHWKLFTVFVSLM